MVILVLLDHALKAEAHHLEGVKNLMVVLRQKLIFIQYNCDILGSRVAQTVQCLATDWTTG
jgi:hypothetical protein